MKGRWVTQLLNVKGRLNFIVFRQKKMNEEIYFTSKSAAQKMASDDDNSFCVLAKRIQEQNTYKWNF